MSRMEEKLRRMNEILDRMNGVSSPPSSSTASTPSTPTSVQVAASVPATPTSAQIAAGPCAHPCSPSRAGARGPVGVPHVQLRRPHPAAPGGPSAALPAGRNLLRHPRRRARQGRIGPLRPGAASPIAQVPGTPGRPRLTHLRQLRRRRRPPHGRARPHPRRGCRQAAPHLRRRRAQRPLAAPHRARPILGVVNHPRGPRSPPQQAGRGPRQRDRRRHCRHRARVRLRRASRRPRRHERRPHEPVQQVRRRPLSHSAPDAEDGVPNSLLIACSTQIHSSSMPIALASNSVAIWVDSTLDTNKDYSFECNQIRYITNTIAECSSGVVHDAKKVFGGMIAQNQLPTTLVTGPGPSIWNLKKIDMVLEPPGSLVCLDGASSHCALNRDCWIHCSELFACALQSSWLISKIQNWLEPSENNTTAQAFYDTIILGALDVIDQQFSKASPQIRMVVLYFDASLVPTWISLSWLQVAGSVTEKAIEELQVRSYILDFTEDQQVDCTDLKFIEVRYNTKLKNIRLSVCAFACGPSGHPEHAASLLIHTKLYDIQQLLLRRGSQWISFQLSSAIILKKQRRIQFLVEVLHIVQKWTLLKLFASDDIVPGVPCDKIACSPVRLTGDSDDITLLKAFAQFLNIFEISVTCQTKEQLLDDKTLQFSEVNGSSTAHIRKPSELSYLVGYTGNAHLLPITSSVFFTGSNFGHFAWCVNIQGRTSGLVLKLHSVKSLHALNQMMI